MSRVVNQEDIDKAIFQDAMKLIVRHDFREAKAYLKVEYEIGGKYDTPKTRFLINLYVLEPEMIKKLYELFPDARFWSEGKSYTDSSILIHLKRPIVKEGIEQH